MNASPNRAREIFVAAVKLAPEQWDAYLQEACGDDEALRDRVRNLLNAHKEAGSFLEPATGLAVTTDEPISERPGTVIGPYKLLEQIGEGGFGVVYMAEQTEPVRRKVALKILKPGMDSRQVVARFEAERQALAIMDHPNIAKVFDGGTTSTGRPYFVMELVKGIPITDFCDQNHLTPRQRLELFVPVCQAVQHAHQKGIIHRDLKPSNVLVSRHDTTPIVKVIDFGVAKALGQVLTDKTLFTGIAQMIGTPLYMSPEQAGMSDLDVDTRSDIYSLGVLLYELLTGTTPFTKERFKTAAYDEIRRIIREEDPPKPSTRLSESKDSLPSISAQRHTEPAKLTRLVRGELDWIVMKAMEKDRNRRYETANGLAMDVRRYLADEAVLACPPSAWYRLGRLWRKNNRLLAAAAVVLLALVVGTAVSTWQAIRASRAEELATTRLEAETEAKNATQIQLVFTRQAEGTGKQRLFRSLVAQARASRLSRRAGQRFDALEALAQATKIAREMNLPETDFLDLRNETIASLVLSDLGIAKEWEGFPAGSWRIDFAGTLDRYALADRQRNIIVRRLADDAEMCRFSEKGPGDVGMIFSPDGRFLAYFRGTAVKLWNLAGQQPALLLEGPMVSFAFSPDNSQFGSALPDGSVYLYDLPSGRQVKQLEAGPVAIAGMAFHPKKPQLAIGHANGVRICDLETGSVLAELTQAIEPGHAMKVGWNPDGRSLAVVGSDRIIHIWDVATRKPIARLEGHKNGGIGCVFNHAGDLLASGGWDGSLRLWDPRTGRQLFQTQTGTLRLVFSPDDRLLAGSIDGNKLRLWQVATPVGYRTLARGPTLAKADYFNSAIHPNGRLLAVGMQDGTDLWDLASGNLLASIKVPSNDYQPLFEPSGALLTNGPDGFYRWPIQPDANSGDRLHVGPPEKLQLPGTHFATASSLDGRVLATAQGDGGLVLHADRPGEPISLKPHWDTRYISVSPNGCLVATGSHSGTKVKIWEAKSGKLEKELPVETGSTVGFSPNGKWLATNRFDNCCLWAVDGWRLGAEIGGPRFAFSPDSKLLAVETGHGVVRLVDPESGREYARLEDPDQDLATLSFSQDGSQLIATSNDSYSIHVWDLRAIRHELAKMDLDWGLLPYPPPSTDSRQPLQVRLDLGDLDPAAPRKEAAPQAVDQKKD
jgi:eukaryotic-like serine/threonine-protein kinase